jgi:radical SAM superfamily enzyme YgiQ (UPF0313 family)
MRILLIYPDILPTISNFKGYINQGVASISASLKKAGHEVKLLHITQTLQKDNIISFVRSYSPSIIGISSTTNQYSTACNVANYIRSVLPDSVIAIGGVHSILNADDVIKNEVFDVVFRGEGEEPFVYLADMLQKHKDWTNTAGTWIRLKDGTIKKNRTNEVVANLDSLPWPDREIWDYPSLQMESQGAASVMFSRGCTRKCTYCCNHAISKVYRESGSTKYFRIRSVDSAIAELVWLKNKYPFIKKINFDDDNLFINLKWAEEFTPKYKKEVNLPFSCNIFPGQIDEKRVALLKKAGCYDIRIGLESGNKYIRSMMLGRITSNEEIRRGYRLCRKAGINTRSFVMVGLPGETPEMVLDTIKIISSEKVGIAQCSIFFPYRNTDLFDICIEKGYLKKNINQESFDYMTKSHLTMDTMSPNQIKMFRDLFPIFVLLFRVISSLPGSVGNRADKIISILLTKKIMPQLLKPLSLIIPLIKKLVPNKLRITRGV